MTPGRIIFLNGTSSSGKSSIARELLGLLDDGLYSHLSVDAFNAMRAQRGPPRKEFDAALRRTRLGFHRSVAAMAEVGDDLECDTSTASPRACAERIRDFLPHRPAPTAFSRLRARYSVEW
ncbi:phosphotransferase-like protein [Streptomyces griseoluteus]|uniref:phosphotransferase-like protein n=1 Tax=Streptomyces griseoluteus TaxID=29306 RepID=UPI0036FFB2AA